MLISRELYHAPEVDYVELLQVESVLAGSPNRIGSAEEDDEFDF